MNLFVQMIRSKSLVIIKAWVSILRDEKIQVGSNRTSCCINVLMLFYRLFGFIRQHATNMVLLQSGTSFFDFWALTFYSATWL